MRRRDILAGAASVAAGAAASFPAPAIAQGIRQLKMVTDWSETMPGLLPGARRLAQTIGEATKGRITIEVDGDAVKVEGLPPDVNVFAEPRAPSG